MNCDVGEATGSLENELRSQLILQPFYRFSYATGFHLRHLASRPCYIGFLWFTSAIYKMPWLVLRILRACVSRQLLIYNHEMKHLNFEIRILLKHYWKQDYKAAAAARRICEMEEKGVVSERVAQ